MFERVLFCFMEEKKNEMGKIGKEKGFEVERFH
jgi:hypothetical protein